MTPDCLAFYDMDNGPFGLLQLKSSTSIYGFASEGEFTRFAAELREVNPQNTYKLGETN